MATYEKDYSRYLNSHGRRPSTRDWGLWLFDITGYDGKNVLIAERVEASGTLGNAITAAVVMFKASHPRLRKVVRVTVLP